MYGSVWVNASQFPFIVWVPETRLLSSGMEVSLCWPGFLACFLCGGSTNSLELWISTSSSNVVTLYHRFLYRFFLPLFSILRLPITLPTGWSRSGSLVLFSFTVFLMAFFFFPKCFFLLFHSLKFALCCFWAHGLLWHLVSCQPHPELFLTSDTVFIS